MRKTSEWSERWEMPFNVNECRILHVGTRNHKFDYEMNGVKIKSVQCVKGFGVRIASNLKFFQQSKDDAIRANKMLDLIIRNFFFKNKTIILPLYINLVRHGICRMPFWLPRHT